MKDYTSYQLKLPIDLSYAIDFSDPVFTFMEVFDHLDIQKYIVADSYSTGRPCYDPVKLLRVILFAFMENGYCSLRSIERFCKTDIRYIWLLENIKAPSFMTIGNFINNSLNYNSKKEQKIIIGSEKLEDGIRIFVYDNGDGIDKQDLNNI